MIKQQGNAIAQLAHYGIFAFHRAGIVHAHTFDGYAKGFGTFQQVNHFGIAAQRFGGYTAAIQAGATQVVTLGDSHLQAMLSSLGSHFVAAGSCSYDNDIEHTAFVFRVHWWRKVHPKSRFASAQPWCRRVVAPA